jgi:predicted transcriptional regulator
MHRVQENIYDTLRASRDALTISQIASIVEVERHTAAKFLEGLSSLGLIEEEQKGRAKMFKASHSPLYAMLQQNNPVSSELKTLLKNIDESITFQDGNHGILWSNKSQEIGKKCYEVFANRDTVCDKCQVTQTKHYDVECQDLNLKGSTLKNLHGEVVGRINVRKSK